MAHAFGQALNISPMEALLWAVKVAAGKVAYIESVLGTASSDLELEGRVARIEPTDPGGPMLLMHPDTGQPLGVGEYRDLSFWVKQSELWHDKLTRSAKMAVDAGVQAWQIERIEENAQQIARVLNAVIDGMSDEITDGQAAAIRALMRQELLRIDEEEQRRALGSGPDDPAVDSLARTE